MRLQPGVLGATGLRPGPRRTDGLRFDGENSRRRDGADSTPREGDKHHRGAEERRPGAAPYTGCWMRRGNPHRTGRSGCSPAAPRPGWGGRRLQRPWLLLGERLTWGQGNPSRPSGPEILREMYIFLGKLRDYLSELLLIHLPCSPHPSVVF